MKSASEYFKRKLDFLSEQMTKVQAMNMEKGRIREGKLGLISDKRSEQILNFIKVGIVF